MKTLSAEDIAFFKREGYLIKREVLDPGLMARALDRMWEAAPHPLDRNDPDTWAGAFPEQRGVWKFRDPATEEWMIRLLTGDPSVHGMAEQLLGKGTLSEIERIRGIYSTFPEGDLPERPTTGHVDRHPFHLGAVGYLDHVGPKGGAFTVWPGSHLAFFHDFLSHVKFEPTDQFERDEAAFRKRPGVECCGGPGDLIFWHHRIMHTAGHNRSRRVRLAILGDYTRKDMEETMEEPPSGDMWKYWEGVR
jgi:hypothetical protein